MYKHMTQPVQSRQTIQRWKNASAYKNEYKQHMSQLQATLHRSLNFCATRESHIMHELAPQNCLQRHKCMYRLWYNNACWAINTTQHCIEHNTAVGSSWSMLAQGISETGQLHGESEKLWAQGHCLNEYWSLGPRGIMFVPWRPK